MQTRQCECVYTYTGSVTDRRFVLQWASPRRERQAKGWISFWNSNIKEAFWGCRWEESLIEGLSWWVGAGDGGGGGLQAAEAEKTEWWVQYHQQDLSWIMMKSRKTAQAWKEISVSLSLLLSLSPSAFPRFFPCCSSLGQQKHLEMKWVSLWQVYKESLPVLEAFSENT